MLFTGSSEHSIDAKQRLAIPAKFRNLWNPERDGHAWMCLPWPGPPGHLRLYPENYFMAAGQANKPTLTPDRDRAALEARLFSRVERLEMDSAGRIILPKAHLERVGLKTEVAVIGAGDRLEIHDLARWKASDVEDFQSMPELVERMQGRPT
jgi:MraZ protein